MKGAVAAPPGPGRRVIDVALVRGLIGAPFPARTPGLWRTVISSGARNAPTAAVFTAWLTAVGACTSAQPPGARAEVRDSAGVRIVENGSRASVRRVRVGPPVFRTGRADEEPTFETIRAGALLAEGQVAVLDGQAAALYLLSPEGDVLWTAGRGGDGPGEFRSGDALEELPDGRLLVYDDVAGRLSLFDRSGAFLESGRFIQDGTARSTPHGVLPGGRVGWVGTSFSSLPAARTTGREWIEGPLLTSGPLGAGVDTVAVLPMVELRVRNGRPVPDPFVRYAVAGVYSEGFVWARNDVPEVQWIDASGSVRQRARWVEAPRRVDETVWAEYEEAFAARAGQGPERVSDERAATRLHDAREVASATLPHFRFISVADDGTVWISRYSMLGGPADTFLVLGADGTSQAVAAFRRPIRLLDVRDGHVLGVESDEWGVQAVVVYRVEL